MDQDPPQSEILAALKVVQQLLLHQITTSKRSDELQCYALEEDIVARKRAAHGDKVLAGALSQVHSQNYEDAMIAETFARAGVSNRRFVEIGVENGLECNTRLLLEQGWSGLWIEGSEAHCNSIRQRFARELGSGQLTLLHAYLTRENINAVVEKAGFAGEVDFLSVDIDMNTHHIWRELRLRARVACIEYNASYPPTVSFEVPYDPNGAWDGSNRFGASLKALERIGTDKGLRLVGCDITGTNAFFVDATVAGDKFLGPYNAETHYEPARYNLLKVRGHRRAP